MKMIECVTSKGVSEFGITSTGCERGQCLLDMGEMRGRIAREEILAKKRLRNFLLGGVGQSIRV